MLIRFFIDRLTLDQIGIELGLSGSRVSQRINAAINELRQDRNLSPRTIGSRGQPLKVKVAA